MNKKLKILLLLPILLAIPFLARAQKNTIIPVESWHYEYIKQLQLRGHLLELHPSNLPYTKGEVRDALSKMEAGGLNNTESYWYEQLNESLAPRPDNVGEMRVGGTFVGGARKSSSERLNVLDPLGEGELALPRGQLQGYFEYKDLVAHSGVTFDWFYDIDPDGLDVGRRLYIRSEDNYFGYNGDYVSLYAGRYGHHWSVHDQQGAFLTENPRSFDQLSIRFGNEKLSFSSVLGELDNMGADSTFTGSDYELGSIRRYVFLHRLDWSPTPGLKLSFIEGELYFSETASISLRNLMPLHFLFFESHNAPLNNNSNLLIGGSIWYQFDNITFYFQGMIDDVDIPSQDNDDEQYPLTYTLNSSITVAGINDSFDLGLQTDIVSVNSYRSNRYQDQWTYAQRGLATNFSDYVRTKVYGTFYPGWLEGLKVEPALTLYLKGTEDLRDLRTPTEPDGSQIPSVLAGTVERTIRPGLYLRYQPPGSNLFDEENDVRFNWWFDADMGVNFVENAGNQEGVSDRRFIGLFRLFVRVTF